MVVETTSSIGFSDAFHNALSEWAGDGSYPFMDSSYEYDFLDDFTRKTSRIRIFSMGFAPNIRTADLPKIVPQMVRAMVATVLDAKICPERIFYRIEEPNEEDVIFVRMWGMKKLPAESIKLQEVS